MWAASPTVAEQPSQHVWARLRAEPGVALKRGLAVGQGTHRRADYRRGRPLRRWLTTNTDRFAARAHQAQVGIRSQVSVPLTHLGHAIGVLNVGRDEARPFSTGQIALLQTFADQAVIAIERPPLRRAQQRTEQLAAPWQSSRRSARSARAVSSSLDLQHVLTTIVSHATRLAQADGGTIFELDDASGEFVHHPHGLPEALVEVIDQNRPAWMFIAAGPAPGSGAAVQIPDIADRDSDPRSSPARHPERLRGAGLPRVDLRAARAGSTDGRDAGDPPQVPRRVSPAVVDLLQTLASQSVLAIENARLFQQVEEEPAARSRQQAQIRLPRQHVPRAADATQRRASATP
ncbi:MAG: GAF domain-containing protein [Chloroflexota bacterium]